MILLIYSPYGNIVNFSHTTQIHFCIKIHSKMQFKPMGEKKPPLPLGAREPPSNTPMPGNDSSIGSHNHTTKFPLITMGHCTFTPNLPLLLDRSPLPSDTPIPQPTPLTAPNGIHIQSAIFPQLTHQRDRQTNRQHGRQTCKNTRLHFIVLSESHTANNNKYTHFYTTIKLQHQRKF